MAVRGRPRTFDRAGALQRAMEVFWDHGYEGTSMSDLTSAMGINSPSLYAAFGRKEELFREAVAYYNDTLGATAAEELRERPTAREAIAAVLRHHAVVFCDPNNPRGCMIVLSANACSDRTRSVHEYLADWRMVMERDFRERIERGIADGDVPATADAAAIAGFYNTVNHGMAIQARDGADRKKLSSIAESAISAWDGIVGA
jgi:AcrR family transcriptional regulator